LSAICPDGIVCAGGPKENAVTGHAALHGGAPAIDRRLYGLDLEADDEIGREEGQHAADDDSLHNVADEGPFSQKSEICDVLLVTLQTTLTAKFDSHHSIAEMMP